MKINIYVYGPNFNGPIPENIPLLTDLIFTEKIEKYKQGHCYSSLKKFLEKNKNINKITVVINDYTLLNAFRLAMKREIINYQNVKIYYWNNSIFDPEEIIIDKYCYFDSWPEGFFHEFSYLLLENS